MVMTALERDLILAPQPIQERYSLFQADTDPWPAAFRYAFVGPAVLGQSQVQPPVGKDV